MDGVEKEVFYNVYCHKCAHWNADAASDVCNDCLNEPGRDYSHKPLNFKEADA